MQATSGQGKTAQRILVLVGLDGSGKLELAAALLRAGWAAVDEICSARDAVTRCRQLLLEGREVVIERCNTRADERREWIRLAQSTQGAVEAHAGILHRAVHVCAADLLQKSPGTSEQHIMSRLNRQQQGFQQVFAAEGYAAVYNLYRQSDVDNLISQLGPGRHMPPPNLPPLTQPRLDFQQAGTSQHSNQPHPASQLRPQEPHAGSAVWGRGPQHSQPPASLSWHRVPRGSVPDFNPAFQWSDAGQARPAQANQWRPPQASHALSHPMHAGPGHLVSQGQHHGRTPVSARTQPTNSLGHNSFSPHTHPHPEHSHLPRGPHSNSHSHPQHSFNGFSHTPTASHSGPSHFAHPISHSPMEMQSSWQQASPDFGHMPPPDIAQPAPQFQHPQTQAPVHVMLHMQPTRQALGGGPRQPAELPWARDRMQNLPASTFTAQESNDGNHSQGRKRLPAVSTDMHVQQQQQQRFGSPSKRRSQDRRQGNANEAPVLSNNIVPLPHKQPQQQQQQYQREPVDETDPRPVLLFDLNGTLTQHTAARRSTGRSLVRPGISHLLRLQGTFRLGIFSSASSRTVQSVIPMLREAAGDSPEPLFGDRSLVFYRVHTEAAPPAHIAAGGKDWDTVKPLSKLFTRLHRVLLVDDDAFKAVEGEAENMVLIPCWQDTDPNDRCIPLLVDALLAAGTHLTPDSDMRQHSASISQHIVNTIASQLANNSVEEVNGEVIDLDSDPEEAYEMMTNIVLQSKKGVGDAATVFVADSSSEEDAGSLKHISGSTAG